MLNLNSNDHKLTKEQQKMLDNLLKNVPQRTVDVAYNSTVSGGYEIKYPFNRK